jgi:hypothetical protein
MNWRDAAAFRTRPARSGRDDGARISVDPAELAALVDAGIERVRAERRNGVDSCDADPKLVRELVLAALAERPAPRDGRDADQALIKAEVDRAIGGIELREGALGPTGDPGPIGPMPRHEWNGTRLRFEIDVGEWGEWVDLRGPKGEFSGFRLPTFGGGGGSGSGAATGNAYFPAGW